jgi:hypothetical protein
VNAGQISMLAQQKFQTDFKFYRELSQAEIIKRHNIFRCLIVILRNERFEHKSDYSSIVFDSPNLNFSPNFGLLEAEEFFKLGVCPIPNFVLNALACEKLAKHFGDLSVCGCFIKVGRSWRLDIDQYLSARGLFLPIRSDHSCLIYGLRVFRYPDDQKSFILKIRGGVSYE